MTAHETPASRRRNIDERAVARVWCRMAAASEPPWLHREIARRMAERLPVIRHNPDVVVQWWGRLGASDAELERAYPQARQCLVEPARPLFVRSAALPGTPWWSVRRWSARPAAQVLQPAEVPAGSGGLLWSNMLLPFIADPPALMAQWRRALAVDGFLMFSTLGPDTLRELAALYRECAWGTVGPAFVDMHDLGDMLVHAGFADPVMDQERLSLSWGDASALLDELRLLGGNTDLERPGGLRTPRWKQRLLDALNGRRDRNGRIAMTFEVVYGHAFNAPPRARLAAQTELPLEDLRAMIRARRAPGERQSRG